MNHNAFIIYLIYLFCYSPISNFYFIYLNLNPIIYATSVINDHRIIWKQHVTGSAAVHAMGLRQTDAAPNSGRSVSLSCN